MPLVVKTPGLHYLRPLRNNGKISCGMEGHSVPRETGDMMPDAPVAEAAKKVRGLGSGQILEKGHLQLRHCRKLQRRQEELKPLVQLQAAK